VLAISGGIGGAKLALGLQAVLPAGELAVAINTGDDFEHLGLAISPDVDTALYTLAGLSNLELGWGRAEESWNCMGELERLGGESWFRLGDKDLAVHIERTRRLASGETLSDITADFAGRFGLATRVLPMSDDPVRTLVETDGQVLSFQEYFVRLRCTPPVRAIRFEGAMRARASTAALELLGAGALDAVIICPSNPYLSVDPFFAMREWRTALEACATPVVAVSPLIAGQAVKGPTAKIMRELALEVSPVTVARHYAGLIDGFVLDRADAALAGEIDVPVHLAQTMMQSLADKEHLAREVIAFARRLKH
jgi:LPPG:FO 2-phospho-L-lactate transferase